MADSASKTPSELELKKARRDTRDEIVRGVAVFIGIATFTGNSLGFPALTKIWLLAPLIVCAGLAAWGSWAHHTQKRIPNFLGNSRGTALNGSSVVTAGAEASPIPLTFRQRALQRAAVIAVLLAVGAWIGSSGRNAYLLATYGSLGDLAVSPASDMTTPATITIQKVGNGLCFSSSATFYVRNATAQDVSLGAISSSFSMTDANGAPIFLNRSYPDITRFNAGVTGMTLLTGGKDDWASSLQKSKASLTTFRRGERQKITIYQNTYGGETCMPDPNGKLAEAYSSNSIVTISGLIAMVLPDGTLRPESIGVSEPAKVVKSF